jgi:hypothetical protein
MTSKIISPERAMNVVRLLELHDTLSIGALHKMMDSPISSVQLRKIVAAMLKEGMLKRRHFQFFGGSQSFYQLARTDSSRSFHPGVSNARLIHNDLCAFAAEVLRRTCPKAIIVRERAILQSKTLKSLLHFSDDYDDALPDVMMVIPSESGVQPIYVAVEVERSLKSNRRINKKFDKYASKTGLDAVIYLSESNCVLNGLRQRYLKRVANRAKRISHYKHHFFMTALAPTRQTLAITGMKNANGDAVSLKHWLQGLSRLPLPLRRDGVAHQWSGVAP